MSLLNNSNAIPTTGGGYNLENSLRFRSSANAYLSRTNSSAPTNGKIASFSMWFKRGVVNSGSNMNLYGTGTGAGNDNYQETWFKSDNALQFNMYSVTPRVTTQVFRDPSAWYHLYLQYDTTQATAANRFKLYLNGQQITAFTTNQDVPLNTNWAMTKQSQILYIGTSYPLSGYFDGYITEIHCVDGQALDVTDFGQINEDTGVWQPIKYTGTYGNNGYYLKGRGTDNSGNGNNWTENNFNTTNSALTTYDIMTDVPTLTDEDTANYCTLNPLRYGIYPGNAAVTLSEANLKATWSGDPGTLISTINIPTTGKWYWEAVVPTQTFNFFAVGVVKNQETTNLNTFAGGTGYAVYAYNGLKYILGTGSAYMAIPAQNTVITVAFDADTGSLYVGAGGSWANGSGSTNQTFSNAAEVVTGLTGDISPAFSFNSGSFIVNFGQRPFTYTPPTGYLKLNTFNLPDSAIEDGSEYFNTVLYTGNNTTNNIAGVGFLPDFVWVKNRGATAFHGLVDSVRGFTGVDANVLYTNSTNAEGTSGAFDSFDADGFSLSTNGYGFNQSPYNYVAWNWKAGGTAVSNTAGTITSQVSANPTAGFSVVTYTGTGGTKTVGHGLGVAPQMVIVKGRNGGTNWVVYHVGMGATKYMLMNTTSVAVTDSTPWNNTSPTSTVVSLGTSSNTNGNTAPFVAYCFAEVKGYSKFGSYTGNGSVDGTFVYTGFRPAYVLIKRFTSATASWVLWDSARNSYNLSDTTLYPNLTNADFIDSNRSLDLVSNGFKIRGTEVQMNASGGAYIYMAFAENPFKNSLAR